jgi:carboxynorspermidine decarboxylase
MIDFSKIPSPCFVLEEKKLRKNLELIKSVKDKAGCTIILALKGFSMYSVFPIVKEYIKGATSSSLNEARLCFEEMGTKAHVYAPAYREDEWDELMKYTGHITFNSINQWNQLKIKLSKGISSGLRINPQYSEVTTDLYNPCIAGSRLGVTADQIGKKLPEGIEGLHFHSLCESDSYALERTLKAVEEKFGHLLHQAKWFNMGGGHLMTREGYNTEHLIALVKNIQQKYNVEVILEPGSAFAWQTGYLRSKVLDIFDSQGINAVILDVSVSAHMPDCIEMPYKPCIWGATDAVKNKPAYRMGGLTCLAGDYVGDYSFKKDLQVGDDVIFDDMIHYTMVKTTTFNGVNLPSIGIWKVNDTFQLIRKYGYESYKDRLS